MGETTRVILKANETEAVFTPENGLEANQKYNYTVTALNAIGSVTSHQHGINFCQLALICYTCINYIMFLQSHLMYSLSVL